MNLSSFKSLIIITFLFLFKQLLAQSHETKNAIVYLTSQECNGRGYDQGGENASRYLAEEFNKRGLLRFGEDFYQTYNLKANVFKEDSGVISPSVELWNKRKLTLGKEYLPDCRSGVIAGKNDLGTLSIKFTELKLIHLLNKDSLIALQKTLFVDDFSYNNSLVVRESNFKGDTLVLAKKISNELNRYAHLLVFTKEKFTHSVSTYAFNNGKVYFQDSIYNEFVEGQKQLQNTWNKIRIQTDVIDYSPKNVIGYLPATRKTKKHIVFTAHYDHIGGFPNGVYFPGANDNAAGTGMLLELMEQFKGKKKRKYNITFIAFSGEEIGLVGSSYYVLNPLFPLKNIKMLINLDMVGSGEEGMTVVNATEFIKQFKLLNEINQKKNYMIDIRKRGKAANSDHHFFTEAGVPSFFIYTMGTNKNYHDVNDVFDNLTFHSFDNLVKLLVEFTEKLK